MNMFSLIFLTVSVAAKVYLMEAKDKEFQPLAHDYQCSLLNKDLSERDLW